MPRKVILNITPQTFIRTTANDKIFFRIPRHALRPQGLKRLKRIERYNEYKLSVSALAKSKQFTMPAVGAGITFFIPCPVSWSKKKKKLHHGQYHQVHCDLDNYLKAFIDSLVSEDKYIAHYSYLCKRWVDFPAGWIEVMVDENTPFDGLQPPVQE